MSSLTVSKPTISPMNSTFGKKEDLPSGGGTSILAPTPSVFQDMSDQETPITLKEVFSWCKRLANYSAVHRAFVDASSTLPVTDIYPKNVRDVSSVVRSIQDKTNITDTRSEQFVRQWKLKDTFREILKSKAAYSNAVVVLSFPFEKTLRCPKCNHTAPAERAEWRFNTGVFKWDCPSCKAHGEAEVYDKEVKDPNGVRLVVLDMEQIDTVKHAFTGKVDTYYTVPDILLDDIKKSERSSIINTPQTILEAVAEFDRRGKSSGDEAKGPRVKLAEGLYYLLTDPTLSSTETGGLSFPTFAATFKDYWQYRTMLKAQEVLLNGYATPRRLIYPTASNTSGNLFEMLNMSTLMSSLRDELGKFQQDPNYVSVVPTPVDELVLGGQLKMFTMSTELRVVIESMCATLGCPLEFLFGGMTFSASSISVKKMHVKFEGDREAVLECLQWAVDVIARKLDTPEMQLELGSFRLADDLQHLQFLTSLGAQNLVSRRRIMEEAGIDPFTEDEAILRDQSFNARIQKAMGAANAETEELMITKGPLAHAKGEAAGLEATVIQRAKLQDVIKSDPKLLSVVMGDPGLVQQIFGMNPPTSQEPTDAGGPSTPDPDRVAPQADEGQVIGTIPPDVIDSVVDSFKGIPPQDWNAMISDMRVQGWPPSALTQIVGQLEQIRVLQGFAPDDRPGKSAAGY